jgi:hypothetical protein
MLAAFRLDVRGRHVTEPSEYVHMKTLGHERPGMSAFVLRRARLQTDDDSYGGHRAIVINAPRRPRREFHHLPPISSFTSSVRHCNRTTASALLTMRTENHMTDQTDDMTVVPLPGDDRRERERIRTSNDRDQRLEQEGKPAAHNRGYVEAADGPSARSVTRVVDE